MNRRSLRKMATIARMAPAMGRLAVAIHPDYRDVTDHIYIQTGFVQRGIGFGWRIADMGADLNQIRPFFELMPVSLGVAVLDAPRDVLLARNKARENNPATAHENRSYQVVLQERPREIALEVLKARGVPVVHIDTSQPIDEARASLVRFASVAAAHAAPVGYRSQVEVLSPPPWW